VGRGYGSALALPQLAPNPAPLVRQRPWWEGRELLEYTEHFEVAKPPGQRRAQARPVGVEAKVNRPRTGSKALG
jgi:hypothetical protein